MIQIKAHEKKCIDLGRRGENRAREVLFDISGWAKLYGQGEAHVIAQRYKDLRPYPVEVTQDNTTVSWVVTSVDNDHPGYGKCELVYTAGGCVVKSVIYQTHTDISLSDPVSPPDSPDIYGDILDSLRQSLADSKELREQVREAREKIDLLGIVNVYVCSDGEYVAGGSPIIDTPDKDTIYLVPQDNEGFQYASWVYENDSWEFVDTLTITLDDDKVDETGSSMNITGAQVGQMVVVKAVDENGKPTEWEAVDTPKIPDNYLKYQIVDEVPTEQEEGVLYIVQTT